MLEVARCNNRYWDEDCLMYTCLPNRKHLLSQCLLILATKRRYPEWSLDSVCALETEMVCLRCECDPFVFDGEGETAVSSCGHCSGQCYCDGRVFPDER